MQLRSRPLIHRASLPETALFDNHGDADLILSRGRPQERLK